MGQKSPIFGQFFGLDFPGPVKKSKLSAFWPKTWKIQPKNGSKENQSFLTEFSRSGQNVGSLTFF